MVNGQLLSQAKVITFCVDTRHCTCKGGATYGHFKMSGFTHGQHNNTNILKYPLPVHLHSSLVNNSRTENENIQSY